MGRKILILVVLFFSLFILASVEACAPSSGTNIYLTDGISVNFEKLDNLGTEGENYILEGNAFIYKSTTNPDEIAVRTTRSLIIISPYSQNYSEAIGIANNVDWYNLVNNELNFLTNKNILTGLSNNDIINIANCSAGTSIIKKDISEIAIILKNCDNWYQISHCVYEIIDGEKQTICPTCGETIFSSSIPSEKVSLEDISIEDSEDIISEKEIITEQKTTSKYKSVYLYLLLLFIIIIIVCGIIISRRYKK